MSDVCTYCCTKEAEIQKLLEKVSSLEAKLNKIKEVSTNEEK